MTEFGGQEGLDEVPSHCRSHCPAAHAEDIHVVVLDSLPGREMIVNQRSTDARNLVGTYRCPDAAAADSDATFDFPRRYSVAERDDKVWIVVVRAEPIRTEIDNLMPAARSCPTSSCFKPNPP